MRIAYIDVVESSKKGSKPSYYSKLCKVAKSESAKDDKSNRGEEDKSDQPHMKLYQPPRIERDQVRIFLKALMEILHCLSFCSRVGRQSSKFVG